MTGETRDSWFVAASSGKYPTKWSEALIIAEPWVGEALCAQTDPEAFFPEKGGSTRDAKKICGSCDVLEQCLDYALRNDERFGIWGGLSERQRRKLRGPKTGQRVTSRTAEEERILREMVAGNLPNVAIAERVGVTVHTVAAWRRELGLPAARAGRATATGAVA